MAALLLCALNISVIPTTGTEVSPNLSFTSKLGPAPPVAAPETGPCNLANVPFASCPYLLPALVLFFKPPRPDLPPAITGYSFIISLVTLSSICCMRVLITSLLAPAVSLPILPT